MAATAIVRGMAWDHPRAVNPLEAISVQWSAAHDCEVDWHARPLKDFEDQPLEELATRYDLVLIDYPFVGFAAESGLIVPVDDWVDADYLADQAQNSVGPSFASYTWHGRQWALAVDAACQVSAARVDLLAHATSAAMPGTWNEVRALAGELAGRPCQVAIPLNPNHAYCAFLSVGIGFAGPGFWRPGQTVDANAAVEALGYLQDIAPSLHPLSRDADPIAISDRMATSDEILYVPLMFGYSSYARRGFRAQRIRFGDAPQGRGGAIGSVLGGVGIALSARSRHAELAADLARLVASRDMQRGLYASSGGQPGHAAAWDSTTVNGFVDDFFTATRRTIEQAFLRPRVAGHRRFQVLAGELVHRFIWERDLSADRCLEQFATLVESLLPDWNGAHDHQQAGAA